MVKLEYDQIDKLAKEYGDAFYILDTEQFRLNYQELIEAFRRIYPNTNIAYSYKTNYTPEFCRIVDEMGGMAEVVSDMEYEIAKRIGVSSEKIVFNGPYKNYEKAKQLLLEGGIVNLDSEYEIALIDEIAGRNPDRTIKIGIRCNFDVSDDVLSRFGFDVDSKEFQTALSLTKKDNIVLESLHCHFASRRLEIWKNKAEKMLRLFDKLKVYPRFIDLGGGLFGKMEDSLKKQFDSAIPTYEEYAEVIATQFAKHFTDDYQPTLLIEPGSALSGDAMKFVSKVINIKTVRSKAIATLLGSIYNINPTLNKKNPPLQVYSKCMNAQEYQNLDFGGFTCIESDYLYRGYNGKLNAGDYVIFGNVGSYSVVLKPPFILPNFAVLELTKESVRVIKRRENFDDLFHTYVF